MNIVNIVLWIIQALLAFAFLGAGSAKLMKSREAFLTDKRMAWANDLSAPRLKARNPSRSCGTCRFQ